jgi:hypothetical protein
VFLGFEDNEISPGRVAKSAARVASELALSSVLARLPFRMQDQRAPAASFEIFWRKYVKPLELRIFCA